VSSLTGLIAQPFDPKSVLLAKHSQHVVLVHFPIALYIAGVLFDLLSRGKKQSAFASAAYFNISLAALSTFPTIATGILAWQFALEGQKLKGALLLHLLFAWASSFLICLSWWIQRRLRRAPAEVLPAYRLAVEALGVCLVALTGHLGGFLSGVNV
jgi:uncharacterized membrane protein